MPLTLSLRFLTARAHLHPWQAHHSDGRVDWPPAPWRLLRALVAAAGSGLTTLPEPLSPTMVDTQGDGDEVPHSRLGDLLAALARTPDIWLPRTSGGHTRHFFATDPTRGSGVSGSAVFDTFAVVSKDTPLHFHWPDLALTETQTQDLAKILRRLTYFGRAESWVEATATTVRPEDMGVQPCVTHWRCVCIEDAGSPPALREHLDYTLERKLTALFPIDRVLQPEAALLLPKCNYRVWRETKDRKTGSLTGTWKMAKEEQIAEFAARLRTEPSGSALLRCLLRSSGEDMKDGLERPIGTRWVHYAVPRAVFQLPRPHRVSRPKPDEPRVTLFRFALNTATVNRAVLPPLTDTLLFADKFRAAALAWHGHLQSGDHPRNFCGREDRNGQRNNGHDHAFFWPMDEDNDGFIDHVSIFCPHGFLTSELDALRRLIRIRQRGGRPDLLVTPVFIGDSDEFGPWRRETTTFVSATPFHPPINLGHGRNSGGRLRSVETVIRRSLHLTGVLPPEDQIGAIRELTFSEAADKLPPSWTRANLLDPRYREAWLKPPDESLPLGAVVGLRVAGESRILPALAFCRSRRQHTVRSMGRMFQIEFSAPRPGRPFAIGAQAHFGLGLFVPVEA